MIPQHLHKKSRYGSPSQPFPRVTLAMTDPTSLAARTSSGGTIQTTSTSTTTKGEQPPARRFLSPRSNNNSSRRPRSDDRDYAQFKARVTEVVNQQHTVSPSSFTSRGRRYAKLRKQKMLASSSLRKQQKERESSQEQQQQERQYPGSFSLDKDIDFFCDEDRGDMPSTIRECSESSSASLQNEKRSTLKDQVDQVLSNVKKLRRSQSNEGKDVKVEEFQPTRFLESDMSSHDLDWTTMPQFDETSVERSCFQNMDSNNNPERQSSPFSFRSNTSSVSPSRRKKSSPSRSSRAADSSPAVSPRSTISTRTPRSALSPPRGGQSTIRSPKSVCSTKTGASRSFFSAGESVFSTGTNMSRRSRSSSPSRSPSRSTGATNRSRSSSPTRSLFSKRSTYKPLSPDAGNGSEGDVVEEMAEDSSFLMVPTLQHPPATPTVSPDLQQQQRGASSLIFRDAFHEEPKERIDVASSSRKAMQSISPIHVPSNQREENFFRELQRPSPDLSQFLPKSCTLSGTDGEEGDADVLKKVTISTTNGIRVNKEGDGSPVDRQIVERILAQLAREEKEEEERAAGLSPRSGTSRQSRISRQSRKPDPKNEEEERTTGLSPRSGTSKQSRKPDPEPVQEVSNEPNVEQQGDLCEEGTETPPRRDELTIQDPPSDHFDLPNTPPSIRRVGLQDANDQGEGDAWFDEQQQVIENYDNAQNDHQGINTAIDYLCHKANPSTPVEYAPPGAPQPDYEPYHASLPPVADENPPHVKRDSFENHPLVALSTTDSSSVPYAPQVHYLQPKPAARDESYHSSTAATTGSTLESLKFREERMARSYQEKSTSVYRNNKTKRVRRGGAKSSNYTIDESYESFETYETSKGFCAALTNPISAAFFCNCMGDIPPPPQKQRGARGDNETLDSTSYIQTTYGRPLPILSASNLSIEDDDMFDVVERCFCG